MRPCPQRVSLRRVALIVGVLLLSARPAAGADTSTPDADPKSVSVTTSLVTPFVKSYYLEAKLRASGHLALVLNASFVALENHDWKLETGTVGAGVDYYFGGGALRRWYVEGIGELWFASQRHEPSGAIAPVAVGYAGIALLGYELVFDVGPVVDVGAGVVAFHIPSARVQLDRGPVASESITRVYPAAKIDVGWAF